MEPVAWTDERLDELSRRFAELRGLIYRFGGGLFVTIVAATLLQRL